MTFDDRLNVAAQARDESGARRLLGGAGKAKLAELALDRKLPEWLADLVRQEREQREYKHAAADPLAAVVACPTVRRLRNLPEGTDDYSLLTLAELRRRVSSEDRAEVSARWEGADDATLAAIYRWVLRGLPPALACRKVHLSRPCSGPQTGIRAPGARGLRPSASRGLSAARVRPHREPKSDGAGAPAWLGVLARVVDASLDAPATKGKLGLRCRRGEGCWEVHVLATPAARPPAPFSVDVRRLEAAFHRVDRLRWNAPVGPGEEPTQLCLEGLFGGHEVRLWVLAGGCT